MLVVQVRDLGDINVTNNLDALDPTGLRDGMIPYIIIAALAVMGLGAGVVVSLKKKIRQSLRILTGFIFSEVVRQLARTLLRR